MHALNLLSKFIAACMYMCLGLTTWDRITSQEKFESTSSNLHNFYGM